MYTNKLQELQRETEFRIQQNLLMIDKLQKWKFSLFLIGILFLFVFGLGIIPIFVSLYFSTKIKSLEKEVEYNRKRNLIMSENMMKKPENLLTK